MKKNSFIQGTVIASISIIITKILGALYVIPFYKIIGESGGVLYSYAYTIYNLFLNISTAGIPIAISMIVSEYNTLNHTDAKERTFKIGNKLVFLLSLFSFIIIFVFADSVALFLTNGVTGNNTLNDIALVIRAISFCLLITPFLSVLRGYLQGHKYIAPTSISQVIEQIARIAIVLFGSFVAIKVLHLSIVMGVAIALTGAFFGALVAYLYLFIKSKKDKTLLNSAVKKDSITNSAIFKKIVLYSIPLILVSVIQTLYDTVDLKLIIKGLDLINVDATKIEVISSVVVTWGPKICMVIVAISMGLTTSLIPHMTGSYTKGDMVDVNNKFNQAVSTMIIATVPMVLAIIVLSREVYYLFYGESIYGPIILSYLAVVNIFMGVLTVINTALQGMKKFKIIYINTIIGLLVNTVLDIPMILLFNKTGILPPYVGTIVATMIGCFTSYVIVFIYLKRKLKFCYSPIIKNIGNTFLPALAMLLVLIVLKLIINVKLTYFSALWQILLIGFVSLIVYIVIAYYNGLLFDVLGKEYIDKFLKKFRLKK